MVQCKCFLYEFINLELYLEYKDPRFYLEILKILESGFIKGFQVQQWIGATMVLKKKLFMDNCVIKLHILLFRQTLLEWHDRSCNPHVWLHWGWRRHIHRPDKPSLATLLWDNTSQQHGLISRRLDVCFGLIFWSFLNFYLDIYVGNITSNHNKWREDSFAQSKTVARIV